MQSTCKTFSEACLVGPSDDSVAVQVSSRDFGFEPRLNSADCAPRIDWVLWCYPLHPVSCTPLPVL